MKGIATVLLTLGVLAHPIRAEVKVFVLAGQSNMEGAGAIMMNPKKDNGGQGSLEYLVKNEKSAPRFGHLVDKKGEWVVREDVFIRYGNRAGGLKPGFGARSSAIGPELGFGTIVGNGLKEPVLLIKTAWGGKSLHKDFRPPSAGGEVGPFYKEMLKQVKETLDNLKEHYPAYDGKGYEIVGFGWHQGWNDGLNKKSVAEYEENLAHLIRDLRKAWKKPELPVVIAVSGFGGRKQKIDRRLGIIAAQHGVAKREEFKKTVKSVETRDFFRPPAESPSRQGYHWNGNAETYYLIGESMGKAMLELLKIEK